ncbi:hypothetical protein [Rubritalea marina]|uniref:hypothetical protein n=1 Tax=Rubritalea marina TaxID=361055 RepID=UPI0012EA8D54|nr:hypothetical protein [Rubritalea marina]
MIIPNEGVTLYVYFFYWVISFDLASLLLRDAGSQRKGNSIKVEKLGVVGALWGAAYTASMRVLYSEVWLVV